VAQRLGLTHLPLRGSAGLDLQASHRLPVSPLDRAGQGTPERGDSLPANYFSVKLDLGRALMKLKPVLLTSKIARHRAIIVWTAATFRTISAGCARGGTMGDFTEQEIHTVYRVMAARRDMRHFRPDPLDEALLKRLLGAAHMAPSVGLMQPWRFVRVRDAQLRASIHALVEAERLETARALGEREEEFMRLKVEGILDCGELLIVSLMSGRKAHVFGRRTLPEMDLASVACAIQNLWLAARAENIGMGWVSLFDPEALRLLLHMPEGSRPVAVLCLGYVPAFYARPMLEEIDWARRFDLDTMVTTDYWVEGTDAPSP